MIRNSLKKIRDKIVLARIQRNRRRSFPEKYKSLSFLLDYLGDNSVYLTEAAKKKLDTTITEICYINSWYWPKDCACLLFKGDNLDAEADKAMGKGAAVLITPRPIRDYPCVVCDNPMDVYSRLCLYYRDLYSTVPATVVCGSIGKTTVKNMIGEVYKMKYKTYFTSSNMNTKEVVGYTVQHIPSWTEQLLQEIHEGEPGETKYISKMLHPDLFVMTPIDMSHFVYFGTPEKIVEEVCSISQYMSPDGTVVVNIDEFDRFELLSGRKVITVSESDPSADYSASEIRLTSSGLSFRALVKATGLSYEVSLNHIYARHNVLCALYAFAAGIHKEISPELVVEGLSHFQTHGVRQNILETADGILVYADCYNAVGRSMESAIKASDLIPVNGKRIAVLGDVEEGGDISENMHHDIVEYVNASKFDYLLTIGEKMKAAASAVADRQKLVVLSYDDLTTLAEAVARLAQKGDLVLFKASHASRLDKCISKIWPQFTSEVNYYSKVAQQWKRESLSY